MSLESDLRKALQRKNGEGTDLIHKTPTPCQLINFVNSQTSTPPEIGTDDLNIEECRQVLEEFQRSGKPTNPFRH